MGITNTTKQIEEFPELFILEALARGSSEAIEAFEKRGQKELVNTEVLPVKYLYCKQKDLELFGVKFGKVCEGDEMFQEVILPDGWKKRSTEHSMWSELVDDKGRVRASIFYKAAFYDRSAHISLKERFVVASYGHGNKAVVLDGDVVLFSQPYIQDDYDSQGEAELVCTKWLEKNYPLNDDCTKYWDLIIPRK